LTTPIRRRRIGAFVPLVAAAVILPGCAGSQASGEQGDVDLEFMEPITLTVSEPITARSGNHMALQVFMEEVEEASDGKITFDVYTDATLHPITEALSALQTGLTDITLYSPSLFAEEVPTTDWAIGLGVLAAGSSPQDMLGGSPAILRTILESEDITQNLADNGAVLLSTWVTIPYTLLCTKPIESLDDAQGVLVRSGGSPWTEELEALGMTPVPVENAELYEALQRGLIDCTLNTVPDFMNSAHWEIAKYWVPVPLASAAGAGYVISKSTWDSLPVVAQDIINDAKAAIAVNYNRITAESLQRWFEEAPDMGVEFLDRPDDMLEVLQQVQSERGANLADTAPAEITAAQQEVDAVQGYFDEWRDLLATEFGIDEQSTTSEQFFDAFQSTADVVDWKRYQELFSQFLNGAE
jgi:TRAP-type C4-dicarboxylate transport system substrate-binding protein